MLRARVSGIPRVALVAIVVATVGCEQVATTTSTSPSPAASSAPIGIATLSDTACNVAIPDVLPVDVMSFTVVNATAHRGRFLLLLIGEGRTFKDIVDWSSGPSGQVGPPAWVSQLGSIDVPAGKSDEMQVAISLEGLYAFHCGYVNDSGTVTAFWHELHARAG